MDNEQRMNSWCRMWNEDPSLAHELMTAESGADGGGVGGVDLLAMRDGRFSRAWSLTGVRAYRY